MKRWWTPFSFIWILKTDIIENEMEVQTDIGTIWPQFLLIPGTEKKDSLQQLSSFALHKVVSLADEPKKIVIWWHTGWGTKRSPLKKPHENLLHFDSSESLLLPLSKFLPASPVHPAPVWTSGLVKLPRIIKQCALNYKNRESQLFLCCWSVPDHTLPFGKWFILLL